MRVYYEECLGGPKERYRMLYKEFGDPDFCCRDMELAWGVFFHFGSMRKGRDRGVYQVLTYILADQETISSWDPVSYCPFCGERIETASICLELSPDGQPNGSPTEMTQEGQGRLDDLADDTEIDLAALPWQDNDEVSKQDAGWTDDMDDDDDDLATSVPW